MLLKSERAITPAGTRFLPGTQGGTNWYGPTYSPPLNLLFAPTIDWATTVKRGGPESLQHEPGNYEFVGGPRRWRKGRGVEISNHALRLVQAPDEDKAADLEIAPMRGVDAIAAERIIS